MAKLNSVVLSKVAANRTPARLVFDSTLDFKDCPAAKLKSKIKTAFENNTSIRVMSLNKPVSNEVIERISYAICHLKHPVEIELIDLTASQVTQVLSVIPMTKVDVLRLTQLSTSSLQACLQQLPKLNQIRCLELHALSTSACRSLLDKLPRHIKILRLRQLPAQSCAVIMQRCHKTQVEMLRLIDTNQQASAVISKHLKELKVIALSLISLSPEACECFCENFNNLSIRALELKSLSPRSCTVILKKLAQLDSSVRLLIVSDLSIESCQEIMKYLHKAGITEVKIINLPIESKVLMLSGLEGVFSESEETSDLYKKNPRKRKSQYNDSASEQKIHRVNPSLFRATVEIDPEKTGPQKSHSILFSSSQK